MPNKLIEEEEKPINFRDLSLLLNAYKNQVELSAAIADQQKQIVDEISKIIFNQRDICDRISSINQVVDKRFSDEEKLLVEKSNLAKIDHSKIINKIYFAFIAPLAILISMVAVLLSLLQHSANIDKIEKILISITKFLGISY